MSVERTKVAASLLVHDADKMTDQGRRAIYKWMRRNAELVLNHGGELSGAFRARYSYQEGIVKNKKAKIKAKAEKVRTKLKGKKVKIVGALALLALLCAGCSTQPSRTNNQTWNDCTLFVTVGGTDGEKARDVPTGDLLTQNMVVETGGSETTAPAHTVSPSTDVSVPVGAGGGESLAGLIGSILGGGKTAAAASGAGCETCAEK